MKYVTSIPNKTQEVVGVLFGIVLFYFWLVLIDKIKMLLFSEVIVINSSKIIKAQYWGQIDQWLAAGLILFFLIFGHYLLCSKNMSRIEKNRDIIGMKSALIGFILWLFITIVTFLFKITFPYFFNIAGGYLIIIFIYFLLKNKLYKFEI
ncbi:hypothetical protein EQO05_08840 [Methanosarcina sp. MSH10X1]|uniref:hypothetical protein n=1 Tax=Methanosarcina sp. MSH10X1 TaxID=2507075 RepID=UPI000FFC9702|nr:hypothetical protein [Methanosarcina sp. MSH10X1]RXA19447.1 hypothetical protein EQO05_08840 [Methanosarcina sp. MSH10X1]